ncbi:2Fe-2S iron-sulfur cluster-binding protein [Pseudomonas sp. PhalM4]
MGSKSPHFNYQPLLTRESTAQWAGRTGRIPAAVLQDHPDLSGFDVYACGSPEMIAQARELFVSKGALPADRFFADAFESTARSPAKPVVSFDIEFAKSSLRGRIRSEVGVTLLEALKNSGLNLDHYCGGGAVCATCRVNVGSVAIGQPEETEADLLDCLVDLSDGDRLACQLTITEALDNALVRLPGRPSHISRLEE